MPNETDWLDPQVDPKTAGEPTTATPDGYDVPIVVDLPDPQVR